MPANLEKSMPVNSKVERNWPDKHLLLPAENPILRCFGDTEFDGLGRNLDLLLRPRWDGQLKRRGPIKALVAPGWRIKPAMPIGNEFSQPDAFCLAQCNLVPCSVVQCKGLASSRGKPVDIRSGSGVNEREGIAVRRKVSIKIHRFVRRGHTQRHATISIDREGARDRDPGDRTSE
jgi:hypothetical protein